MAALPQLHFVQVVVNIHALSILLLLLVNCHREIILDGNLNMDITYAVPRKFVKMEIGLIILLKINMRYASLVRNLHPVVHDVRNGDITYEANKDKI